VHPTTGVVLNALVDVRGDLVAASGDNTPVRLAAGSNGQMLMADSAATAGLRYVDPPTNRNLLINGAMQVHQRGTSSTNWGVAAPITADRWAVYGDVSGSTNTLTVENDAPTGSGLRKSLKCTITTGGTVQAANETVIFQRLEGQDLQRIKKGTASAEQLTLSFWVKSNKTGTMIAVLTDMDNPRRISAAYSVSSANTWERKTITYAADTTGALDNDNANSMQVVFCISAGSNLTSGTLGTTWATNVQANTYVGHTNVSATNDYWQVTGVQLETGPVATPFEFEPVEATLRKCQRYYWLAVSGTSKPFGTGYYYNATNLYSWQQFPQTMRTAPSVSVATGTNYYQLYVNSAQDGFDTVSIDGATAEGALLLNNAQASGTAGQTGFLWTNNAAASIAFSAEL
jgi:hypothetical protein